MKVLFKKLKQGFTLIELLAVIIILGVIIAITVPTIKGVIKNSTKEAFLVDAKNVIKAVDYYLIDEEEPSLLETLKVSSLEDMLKISGSNYLSIDISFDRYLNPFIKLVGKDKWEGLTACGTSNDLEVGSDIDCEVLPFPAILPDGQLCGSVFYDFRDGNKYKTVQIGKQCWFGENLRYTGSGCLNNKWDSEKYNACRIHTKKDCQGTNSNYYCSWSGSEVLYQWGVVEKDNNEQDLCPAGWHVSSKKEWEDLITFLGDNAGDKIKSKLKWNGSNEALFNAFPIGDRIEGSLFNVGTFAYWWTSTTFLDSNVWYYYIYTDNSNINFIADDVLDFGYSVRCVLNSEI
ncbi:MAG: FISUMP domain-containing protein [Bacilli bacterium]|jgi:uncharacterized protein (TIGR02145 family)/prepilin-type N-terminal cleavage/methylation domain-containing protein